MAEDFGVQQEDHSRKLRILVYRAISNATIPYIFSEMEEEGGGESGEGGVVERFERLREEDRLYCEQQSWIREVPAVEVWL